MKTGYKAFHPDLTTYGGFQWEIGKTYELPGVPVPCEYGFHFCENLEDCFAYYPLDEGTRICEVEADEPVKQDLEDNNKYCTTKLKVVREIDITEIKPELQKYCNLCSREEPVLIATFLSFLLICVSCVAIYIAMLVIHGPSFKSFNDFTLAEAVFAYCIMFGPCTVMMIASWLLFGEINDLRQKIHNFVGKA